MDLRLTLVLTAATFGPWASAAEGWTLAPCPASSASRVSWNDYESRVRAAAPGSPLHLPHPFATDDAGILENYRCQYRSAWSDTKPEALPAEERAIFAAVAAGTARFEIHRVENWSPSRCGGMEEEAFLHLIRVFDATGIELARTVLAPSGFLVVSSNTTEKERSESIADQADRLASPAAQLARLGLEGEAPQLVTTAGQVRCPPYAPCLAFRREADVWIVARGATWVISAGATRWTIESGVQPADALGPALRALAATEQLMSLGGREYTVAKRLER
jgi:hypothetical protein